MPIYEYRCADCNAHLEIMQKVSDEPLTLCEKCGGKLEKQWSLSGFQFKGEGWYVTDYSKKSGTPADASKSAEKSSSTESTTAPETASKESSTGKTTETAAKKD